MIKKIFLAIAALTVCIPVFSRIDIFKPIDDYKTLKKLFFPRDENSQKERELIEYIKQFCDNNGLNYRIDKIDNRQDIITNSYNIEINLNGNNRGRLIVLCPLNSELINQENYDNSISLQIVFDLILKCSNHIFNKNITFLFSGANTADKTGYYGAKYFLENSDDLSKSFVTVIDLLDFKSGIRFSGSINGRAMPAVILKKFLEINRKYYGIYFNRDEIYQARFDIKTEDSIASLFLKQKINAVLFYNRDEKYDNEIYFDNNSEKNLSEFFYTWLIQIDSLKLPIKMDYHYIYFDILGLHVFIPEIVQITAYILIIFITIMSRLLIPAFKKYHFGLLLQNLPYFSVLFVLYFVFSFIPLLSFLPVSQLTGISKAYLNTSFVYFLDIFFVPLLIIFILFNYLKNIFKIRRSYIYIYGAFVFCVINLFVFFIIDISIAMTYLWACLLITLTQFIKKRFKLKYVLYTLSSAGMILLLFDLTFSDSSAMLKTLNPVLMNFIYSLMTFPVILLLLRALTIYMDKTGTRVKKRNLALIITGIIMCSLIVLISISIFTEQKKGILRATLVNEHDRNISTLSLQSNLPIGELYMESGIKSGDIFIPKPEKEFLVYSRKLPYTINYELKKDNSYNFVFRLDSAKTIELLKIYLVVPKNSLPVNSSFVFNKINNPDYIKYNRQYEDVYLFNSGRNPGDKIEFQLELSDLNNSKIYFIPEYPYIDPSVVLIRKPEKIIEYKSVYIESYDLENLAFAPAP